MQESELTIGIDVGTTSVAGVAVGPSGEVIACVSRAHGADIPACRAGVHEQDPMRLLGCVNDVIDEIKSNVGSVERIGWTGQMHGIVAVDGNLDPISNFVTWRDARRYGGRVMAEWARGVATGCSPFVGGAEPYRCLPVCGWIIARRSGECMIDRTFLESWHLEEVAGRFPAMWVPDVVEGAMLGDNQAGVYAAQSILPGCAVVNLGTSGQLSVVGEGRGGERRAYPGNVLRCRASLVGGVRFAELRRRLGVSYEELNARAEEPQVAGVIDEIVNDLAGDVDVSGITGLVGVGNALRLNPALRKAVEHRFGRSCVIPEVTEMAAYGAARYANACAEHLS